MKISYPLIFSAIFRRVIDQNPKSRSKAKYHPFGGCNSTYASFGKACIWLHAQNPDMAAFPDIPTYVNDWRMRNGQERDVLQTVTFQNQTVTCKSSGNKLNNVTLCVAEKEGHSWPGANIGCSKLAPQLNCTNDIDASNAVWNFFESLV